MTGQKFFSADLSTFFKNRFLELLGLLFIFIAIFILLALVSHNPSDPSFNTATEAVSKNMMGYPGAYTADILLQLFGFASYIFVPVFVGFGVRFLIKSKVHYLTLKFMLLPILVGLLATFLANFSFLERWESTTHKGGMLGFIFSQALNDIPHIQQYLKLTVGTVSSILAFVIFMFVTGLKWKFWYAFFKYIFRGLWVSLLWCLRLFTGRDSSQRTSQTPTPKASRTKARQPSPTKKPVNRPTQKQGGYLLPPVDLLAEANTSKAPRLSKEALTQSGTLLAEVLDDFGVRGEITHISPGPVVTLYKLTPAPGTKSSRVIGLADDISRSMSAISARIAVIPGYNALGIELPNEKRQTVFLRELITDKTYTQSTAGLPLVLGKDIGGDPIIVDLARMPHLLIAGTTGSGKSVSVNTMILSLLYALPPEKCRFIMIDPKMLELSVYDDIPHLLAPVVTDPHKAVAALKWVVREMEIRYQNMSKLGVRNVDGFNARIQEAQEKGEVLTRRIQTGFDPETGKPLYEDQELKHEPLPYIVVIVDEMADLMLVAGKDIESAVQRLAQMARAAGIHLIMATQRPSVDVITGTIKANFPTRISFQVTSKIDSRTILGEQGAEQLLGQGDMLYMAPGGRVTRIHGPFVSDKEVESIVKFLKSQGKPTYIEEITTDASENSAEGGGEDAMDDPLYRQALELILREKKASTSFIQRHLKIGYNRAARLIDDLETNGVISPANHVGKREILQNND